MSSVFFDFDKSIERDDERPIHYLRDGLVPSRLACALLCATSCGIGFKAVLVPSTFHLTR
jgi:hypothetical protein